MRPPRDYGIRAGVRRLFRLDARTTRDMHADADEELASVIDERVADLVARGMTPGAAHDEAVRRLGTSVAGARTRLRGSAARRERRMRAREIIETIAQDLRFAVRQMLRAPGITAVAVITLGIGVGANSAIFALVDAILLRQLPVPHPGELVAIGRTTSIDGHTSGAPRADLLSFPTYQDLLSETHVVTGLAASGTAGRLDVRVSSVSDGAFEHTNGRFVSANYFSVLEVRARIGRVFGNVEDGAPGTSPVAVISDAYWHERFGGTPDVVGRHVTINGVPITIIGVAAPDFQGDVVERPTQIWLPISMQPVLQPHTAPIRKVDTAWLLLLGRLAPGVTLEQARARYTTLIHASLVSRAQFPSQVSHLRVAPVLVSSGAQGFSAARVNFRGALLTLQVGVALLLLIVCANLANLLLGRSLARGTELSVRLALGAGRGRLVRQLMTESALVATLGALSALAFAWWGSAALSRAAATADSPVSVGGGIDVTVLAFTLAVSVGAVLLFGLAPALRASRADLASSMRARMPSLGSAGRVGRIPIGALLVPAQVALCVVLLTGAAVLARSLMKLESRDPGMDHDHLVVAEVDAARRGLAGDRFIALANNVTAHIGSIPGVRAATYSQNGLFLHHDADAVVAVPGFVGRTQADSSVDYDLVGSEYLHAIGARFLAGRDVSAHDVAKSPSVAVLNELAATFYFGSARSAIGRVIYFDASVPTTVVGVVADVRDHSLTAPIDRRAYAPYAQQIGGEDHPFLTFEIRTAGDPAAVIPAIHRAISAVDPELPQARVSPLTAVIAETIREQRLLVALAIGFGAAALLLALVGLYGVMSYAVARRTAEIGLRSALGADQTALLRLVIGDALRLVGIGVAVGVPLALGGARALRGALPGVPSADAASMGFAVAAIAACAVLAALAPAVRAARVSPIAALAQE